MAILPGNMENYHGFNLLSYPINFERLFFQFFFQLFEYSD